MNLFGVKSDGSLPSTDQDEELPSGIEPINKN
jgi:hypothetical protein